jgi:hypothetical protein
MKTKVDLVTAIMQQSGILDADSPVTASDSALVEAAYDSKLAEWRRRGFVWWTNSGRDVEEIPGEVFATLTELMINDVKGSFQQGGSPVEKMAIERELLKPLRQLNHKPPSGESTPFSVF